jgi:DNA-binding PadR family transcriptional regulator
VYELIILGFLMMHPFHGYRIAKIINDMIGPFAKVSSGRLYPLFAKLEKDGLIDAIEDGDNQAQTRQRRQKMYKISETGAKRFHQLMMDTTSNLGEYQKLFSFKFVYINLLLPDERLYLLDHYINHCQAHLFHIGSELEDMRQSDYIKTDPLDTAILSMEHYKSEWQLELDWAKNMRVLQAGNSTQRLDESSSSE